MNISNLTIPIKIKVDYYTCDIKMNLTTQESLLLI